MALNDKLINYGNLAEFHNQILNDTGSTTGVTWSASKLESELASKQDTLVAGDGIQINGNTISATGGGGGGSATIENVTYAQLKAKRDNSQLVKGQQYRITDYVTMANSGSIPVSSAEHPFDLIVTAIDVNKLSETGVKAVKKANDNYFTQLGETVYRWKGSDYNAAEDAYLYTEERYFPNASAGTCSIEATDFYEQDYYTTTYDIVGVEYVDSEYGDLYINPNKVILYIDENNHIVFGDSPYEYYLEQYNEETEAGVPHELTLEEVEWFNGKYFVDYGDSDNMEMSFDRQVMIGAVNADLDKWELKYCIDNDKTRFDWAQVANPGLGFSAIKVSGVKERYYIDEGTLHLYYNGTVEDSGVTYYRWYTDEIVGEIWVLTTELLYTNEPSGVDEDGCSYYNKVYDFVGEITIDGETYTDFYNANKRIIYSYYNGNTYELVLGDADYNCAGTFVGVDEDEGEVREPNNFIYKRYESGDTQDSYAWAYVKDSIDKEINDISIDWNDIDINDVIYTSSLTPSAGTMADDYEVVEYSPNVHYIAANGKGVIFYLKDEFENEVEYDFKNILFKNKEGYNYTFGKISNTPEDDSLVGDSKCNIIKTTTIDNIKYIDELILGNNIVDYTNKPKNIWCGTKEMYDSITYKISNMLYLIYEE